MVTKIMRKWMVFLVVLIGIGILVSQTVQAEVVIDVDREFTLSQEGVMSVQEMESARNTFADRYIPAGSERTHFFVISAQDSTERQSVAEQIYNSLEIEVDGAPQQYNRLKDDNLYGFSYQLTSNLDPGETQRVSINYQHPELGEKVGGLLDAYIPAFAENFQFDLGNTKYRYFTKLKIPQSTGQEGIVSIEPTKKYQDGRFDIYEFAQEDLIGNFVWVQRGSEQVYKFRISQEVLATQTADNGEVNDYELIIPRDINEVNVSQKVYITSLSPEPTSIRQDDQGNLIGVFRLPAYRDEVIEIEGYAKLEARSSLNPQDAGNLASIDASQWETHLSPAPYWEVRAEEIQEKAAQFSEYQNVYNLVENVYADIVDSIDYSQVKRFGLNERQGALQTLRGGAAVCMEYSDLFLTIMRAAGVPTRAAFGYGYDSRLGLDEQEPHQWVQVYLPGYDQWISVDVTWGETGPAIIGGDLNHFYTHVAARNPNSPPILSRTSLVGASNNLLEPQFLIEPLAELPSGMTDSGLSTRQLLEQFPYEESAELEFFTTNLTGKFTNSWRTLFIDPTELDVFGAIVILITLLLTFVVVTTAGSLVLKVFRKS